MTSLGILIFIAFVLIAIALHEFGHFATAKAFGIKVERFFIGFGPKLWSTTRGETEYGISAFPLGGYVRIAGMNPLEEIKPEDRARTFKAKPAWQRAIVLAAGSVTHFIVALIISATILSIAGDIDLDRPTTVLGSVGSQTGDPTPSQRAGLKSGDRVRSIAGQPVDAWSDLQGTLRSRPGETIQITVEREGRTITRSATLATCVRLPDRSLDCEEPLPDGERIGFLGVSPRYAKKHFGIVAAVGQSVKYVGIGMKESVVQFGKIFTPSNLNRLFSAVAGNQERPENVSSLVGAGKVSGDLARRGDFASLFLLVAGFNVFIGVVNLLPLPPLDGGHLAVLGYEKIVRRDVDMRRLLPITAMVLTVLGMLFFVVLWLDIVNPLPSIPG